MRAPAQYLPPEVPHPSGRCAGILFDAEKHEYRLGDVLLPSVTEIIRANVSGWNAGLWFLQRGQRVHEAIHLLLENKLDWETVDPRIFARINAIEKLRSDLQLTLVVTEFRLFSRHLLFAGTLDAVICSGDELILCDWKSSLDPVALEPQLGGYSLLWSENFRAKQLQRVVGAELHDDGTYKLWWGSRQPKRDVAQFNLNDAEKLFLHMHAVAGWKRKHNQQKETANV